MQREINLSDPNAGVVDLMRNTADRTISVIDTELIAVLAENRVVKAKPGYARGAYDEVCLERNGAGIVTVADGDLEIYRRAP